MHKFTCSDYSHIRSIDFDSPKQFVSNKRTIAMLPTLYYLPVRARAEPIRMILAYGEIPFNDVIVSFEQWPELKSNKTTCPFGQLPCMTLANGVTIAQSGAIVRYVAKLANIYPHDPERAAKADMIQELTMEMNPINPVLNWFAVDSDAYNSMHTAYFAAFPSRMEAVQSILGNEKFFGGDAPCHADFVFFHIIDVTLTVKPDALAHYTTLSAWLANILAIPQLQQYLASRPGPPDVGREGSLLRTKL